MLIAATHGRSATLLRLAGLIAVVWSIFNSGTAPATSGRGLAVLVALIPAVAAWLVWTFWSSRQTFMTADLYGLAVCGGVIQAAAPTSAGSVFTFVVAMAAAARSGLPSGLMMAALGSVAVGVGAIIYNHSALSVLAYALGFAATTLGGANIRQSRLRLEQTELLLAQTQRSHEEQLRAARLEESARIARDIHDVLAHTLAGLVIQLDATDALLAQGAEAETIRPRVQQAGELAREGLQEARRAVGALRQDPAAERTPDSIRNLIEAYGEPVELSVSGDEHRLRGPVGDAAYRVVQEALTNARKHAAGAAVSVDLDIGPEAVEVRVANGVPVLAAGTALGSSGGGYGLRGMRERAAALGGTLTAGPGDEGWRVVLRLPLRGR